MPNRLSLKKALLLAVIVTSVLNPHAYAQRRGAPSASRQAAVQTSTDSQKRVPSEPFARTELFFGAARPSGSVVTEEEWRGFLEQEVTPRFPEGLTVLFGSGQFRDSSGAIVEERTRLLILLYPVQTWTSSSEKIEQIREAYKGAFQQQSVLRVDDRLPVSVSFKPLKPS